MSCGSRYSKMAWTSWSFVPKWYWTAELLVVPAAWPIWRSDTPSTPCSANNRSAVRTSCSFVEGAIDSARSGAIAPNGITDGVLQSNVLEYRQKSYQRLISRALPGRARLTDRPRLPATPAIREVRPVPVPEPFSSAPRDPRLEG